MGARHEEKEKKWKTKRREEKEGAKEAQRLGLAKLAEKRTAENASW